MLRTIFKALVVIALAYVGLMAVLGVQYFFDRGDMKKAARVVYEYRPRGHEKTLVELMAQHYGIGGDQLKCETQIISRYEGRVLVECGPPDLFKAHDAEVNFQWEVDVVGGAIRELNEKAKKLRMGWAGGTK